MGNLLDPPEYPNHKPIPDHQHVEPQAVVAGSLALSISAIIVMPALHEHGGSHDHVPHREYVEVQSPQGFLASGWSSSSDDSMGWQNSSSMDAAVVAIRR